MILHLISDDKFTDFAISQFEEINKGKNLFLIDENNPSSNLKYVKKSHLTKVEVLKRGAKETEHYIQSLLPSLDAIIVHNLNYYRAHLINLFGGRIKVSWVFYGSDVYESFKEFNDFKYLPLTQRIGYLMDIRIKLRNILRPLFFTIKNKRYNWNFSKREALSKIDFFANANYNGFEEISNRLDFHPKWVWHSYYAIDDMVKIESNQRFIKANNILIGNSATPSNNHLDTLDLIKTINNKHFSKIIIPLNYGNKFYKKVVKRKSNKLFVNRVEYLEEFLPLQKYVEKLQSCKYQVMNHLRPQATGNIIVGLSIGAMVFINERNPLFEYFTSLGIKIFSVQNDLKHLDEIKLELEDVESNNKILREVYSKKAILKGAKAML